MHKDLNKEEIRLIKEGKRLRAIKNLRDRCKVVLAIAVSIVDKHIEEHEIGIIQQTNRNNIVVSCTECDRYRCESDISLKEDLINKARDHFKSTGHNVSVDITETIEFYSHYVIQDRC